MLTFRVDQISRFLGGADKFPMSSRFASDAVIVNVSRQVVVRIEPLFKRASRGSRKCFQQLFSFQEIFSVKAFCEPVVDLGEHSACLVAMVLFI